MGFRHRVIEQDGQRLHEVADSEQGYRIQVNNHGAELVSIARREPDGTFAGYLYRDADVSPAQKGWQSHATIMGYFLHRLKGEKSVYEGDEIRGGNHSFLRHKLFDDPDVLLDEAGALTYSLPVSRILPLEYPRKVSFQIAYRLHANTVQVTFRFHNEEAERQAHVSFGLHPGFAVSSVERARVVLPRGTYKRHLAPDNFLSGETVEFESDGATMPIKPFELPGSFLLEPIDVDSHVIRLQDAERHREVELDFSEAPYFTLWSDLNPFICIEPCWGLPDHQDQRPFEMKLGIQTIPALGTLTRQFSIRLS
jgi:galactose mutarotase-like enzyme